MYTALRMGVCVKPAILLALAALPVTLNLSAQATGAATQKDVEARIQAVESCLLPPVLVQGEPKPCTPLLKRMAELHVTAVSIAVVHNGAIEWARAYGIRQLGGEPANTETLFQAGSISKPVAALGTLHLVEQGRLSLDSDINASLTAWKLPPSAAAPAAVVTLRQLLTHTAGITVHGFPGYAAGEPVPTVVQVLNGEKPANTSPIRVDTEPGKTWRYSGGGFTIMQQAVLDTVKEPYLKFLHDTVLAPIGMQHSTYEQPLPQAMAGNVATPYEADGTPVKGGPHTYPEMAAAGLWTTPSDICRYILEVQNSLAGKASHVLSQAMTRQMLTPGIGGWGLGVEAGGPESNPWFSHGGVNEGYESDFFAYDNHGDGVAVMTNAQGGSRLAGQVESAVAEAYHWPDRRPVVRTLVKVDPAVLARYAGKYKADEGALTFLAEGDQLIVQFGNGSKLPVFPESQTKFFLKVATAEYEFVTDDKGQVSSVIMRQGTRTIKGIRQ
jgi:CubicO group peptidase (beta-lactamase class C family)